MLNPEKYFDDIYEYVDLWVSGYTVAYCNESDFQTQEQVKMRMIESILRRLDVINSLRSKLGLDVLTIDDSYDYYINNLPEYNDVESSIDLKSYDDLTEEYSKLEKTLSPYNADIKIYLILMGAPKVFIENKTSIEKRVETANRLFVESGYNAMEPKEIENLLIRMLTVRNDY